VTQLAARDDQIDVAGGEIPADVEGVGHDGQAAAVSQLERDLPRRRS
jgi:hypothetical protein